MNTLWICRWVFQCKAAKCLNFRPSFLQEIQRVNRNAYLDLWTWRRMFFFAPAKYILFSFRYCQPPRTKYQPHNILIEWSGDKRGWSFCICLVYRVNAQILQDRILLNVHQRNDFERTKAAVIRRLRASGDDDVKMDSLQISLLCPVGFFKFPLY